MAFSRFMALVRQAHNPRGKIANPCTAIPESRDETDRIAGIDRILTNVLHGL
jgi:hypothetical protein